jgi:hypothetical protein
MQAHLPDAGFVCAKSFGDTFPTHKKLYQRVLFDLACPVPASPWPHLACSDTTAAQSTGVETRAVQAASTGDGDAGATSLSVAPAYAAAHNNGGESVGGAAARLSGVDDSVARVDTVADPAYAAAHDNVGESAGGAAASHDGERGGGRIRARVRVDPHLDPRPRLMRQFLSSSPVRARPRTRPQRHGRKSTILRPLALAAHVHDDSEHLLAQAIRRAQLESQSFPYTVSTRSGEAVLPLVRGYTKLLWIDRAIRNPRWFATIVQLRALQTRIDALFVGAHQSPRPLRTTQFAGATVSHATSPPQDTFPPDTPLDVRHKKAWEVPVPTTGDLFTGGTRLALTCLAF